MDFWLPYEEKLRVFNYDMEIGLLVILGGKFPPLHVHVRITAIIYMRIVGFGWHRRKGSSIGSPKIFLLLLIQIFSTIRVNLHVLCTRYIQNLATSTCIIHLSGSGKSNSFVIIELLLLVDAQLKSI